MSAFSIWAIILTGIYIIYYPVVICLDLFKKKGQEKDGVEVFNTNGDAVVEEEDEHPTDVVETENGYRVGVATGDNEENNVSDDTPEEEEQPQPILTPEQQKEAEIDALKDRLDDALIKQGEVIIPSFQQTLDSEALALMMNIPLEKKSHIKRTQIL